MYILSLGLVLLGSNNVYGNVKSMHLARLMRSTVTDALREQTHIGMCLRVVFVFKPASSVV